MLESGPYHTQRGKMKTKIDPGQGELDALLKRRSFDALLKSGDVLNVRGAMGALGYKSAWGLRFACKSGKIGHIRRGSQYFFLLSQVKAALQVVSATRVA